MLPKKNRVDKKTIKKIFEKGKTLNSLNLTLKFIITQNNKKQINFITPKKISKKVVLRNLLRRRGYFVLKKYFRNFPNGFLAIFIFGKKSIKIFGLKKNKKYNPILNLENEIKKILDQI